MNMDMCGIRVSVLILKNKLKFKEKINWKTQVYIVNGNGRTESYLYKYISYLKCEPLIKFNAISGFLMETICYIVGFLIICFLYYLYQLDIFISIACLFSMLEVRAFYPFVKGIGDGKNFKHPEYFKYNYNKNFVRESSSKIDKLSTYVYVIGSFVISYLLKLIFIK